MNPQTNLNPTLPLTNMPNQQVKAAAEIVLDGREDIIRSFIANARQTGATDIHIPEDRGAPIRCRIGGKLTPAINWAGFTDGKGLPTTHCPSFSEMSLEFFPGGDAKGRAKQAATYRFDGHQVRLQVLNDVSDRSAKGAKILARVQPSQPPLLAELLADNPGALDALVSARGLVVVAGPMNGGKTTFAASLALAWADNPRQSGHIITVEDPIEYRLQPKIGSVTQLEANLTGFKGDGRTTLEDCECDIRRGDMDGLFIGEVLSASILRTALKYGCTKEPVVTTLHAGSVSDALLNLFNVASESYGMELARALVLKNLHSIVYSTLAFDPSGRPVPVIRLFQFRDVGKRSELLGLDPVRILTSIEDSMMRENQPGIIGPNEALNSARKRGATDHSARKALG